MAALDGRFVHFLVKRELLASLEGVQLAQIIFLRHWCEELMDPGELQDALNASILQEPTPAGILRVWQQNPPSKSASLRSNPPPSERSASAKPRAKAVSGSSTMPALKRIRDEMFAQHVASGVSQSEAYRRVSGKTANANNVAMNTWQNVA